MMKYYPVFLDVKDKSCLVVGGGPVGVRKAAGLAKAKARVTIVSPAFSRGADRLSGLGVVMKRRAYRTEDLKRAALVFAATGDAAVNRRIMADAGLENVPCNSADAPETSDFILPSVIHRGDLIIAVSTSGASPAMAKKIRKDLEKQFGEEYGTLLSLLRSVRKKLLASGHAPDAHRRKLTRLIESGLPEKVAQGDRPGVETLLTDILGASYCSTMPRAGEGI